MKLVNAVWGINLDFSEERPMVLVIEQHNLMAHCAGELYRQCCGKDGEFILSESQEFNMEKSCQLILDPFALNLNSKRILNLLYKKLALATDNLLEEKAVFTRNSILLLEKNLTTSGIVNLTYRMNVEWIDLYKLLEVRIEESFENLLDKLVTYIKVIAELGTIRLVVFVGLCAFLNTEERSELEKMASYVKIQLLFLEHSEPEVYLSQEIRYIIDKDLCWIQS